MGGSWHSFGLGLIYENPDRFLPSNVKDHFSPSIYFPQNLIINFDVVYKHSLRLHRQRYHAPVNAMKYSFFVRSENHNKRCNNVLTQSIKFECQRPVPTHFVLAAFLIYVECARSAICRYSLSWENFYCFIKYLELLMLTPCINTNPD